MKGIDNPAVPSLTGDPTKLFGSLFGGIIGVLLVIGSLWALIQLLLGGIGWISSGGDKGKLEQAQHQLRNALIGLVILFASWALFLLVLQWLGMSPAGSTNFEIKLPTLL